MSFRRRNRILSGGKSPSFEALKRTYNRAVLNGGLTIDFDANVKNIREISTKLGYNILSDAPFVYVPSSYGESKNFAQVQNKRNLLLWSEDFTQTSWIKTNTTVSVNTNLNPFGTNKSYYILDGTSSSSHQFYQILTPIVSQVYTVTYYIKKAQDTWVQLAFDGGGFPNAWTNFNFDTGLFGNNGGGALYTVTAIANGYYKIVSTATCTVGGSRAFGAIQGTNNTNSIINFSYLATNRQICDVAAIQLETGAYATPYQKTVAAGDGIVDFNFTRATSSTVTNKLGVIEDSCYNLVTQSENFNNGVWVSDAPAPIRIPNSTTAPNGTLTAYKLTENASASFQDLYFFRPASNNGQYTASFYVKAAERNIVSIWLIGSSGTLAYKRNFDLTNGTLLSSITVGAVTNSNSFIENIGNGWYRCSVTASASFAEVNCFLAIRNVDNFTTYTGTGGSGIYIWGAQLTQGSTPRPYLRTTNRLNVSKLDYSRSLLEPSLLIERQATNSVLQSETLDNAYWTRTAAIVTPNVFTSPTGSITADKLIATSVNSVHAITNTSNITSTLETYTYSVYAKAAEENLIVVRMSDNSTAAIQTVFNLTTGVFTVPVVAAGSWTNVSNKATLLSNGWYRIELVGQIGAGTTMQVSIYPRQSPAYTGDDVSGLYIFGAQVEKGSNATTYIPTTTATVTRNAENSYVDLWNNALLNQNNFTLYWEGFLYDGQATNMSICLSDTTTAATNTNQLGWFEKAQPFYNVGGIRASSGVSATNNTYQKCAMQFNAGTVNFYRNGVNIYNVGATSFDYRYLVVNSGGSIFSIDKISLFNRTLSNSECVTLTT